MAYWLDDGFDTWPQAIRAGSPAVGLYVRCGAWIARNTTDGLVPAEVAAMYGTPEWVKRLVDVGLWEADGQGYRDLFYFEHGNPTAELVRKRKADAAERQRRFRESAARRRVTRDTTRDSRGSNAVSNGASHSSPALPPPLREGGAVAPPASRAAGTTPEDNPYWRDLPAFGQLDAKQAAVNSAGAAEARKLLNGHKPQQGVARG